MVQFRTRPSTGTCQRHRAPLPLAIRIERDEMKKSCISIQSEESGPIRRSSALAFGCERRRPVEQTGEGQLISLTRAFPLHQ